MKGNWGLRKYHFSWPFNVHERTLKKKGLACKKHLELRLLKLRQKVNVASQECQIG